MVGTGSRCRRTVLHLNPHHPVNTSSGSTTNAQRKKRAASRDRSRSQEKAPAARPAPQAQRAPSVPRTPARDGVVSNRVEFRCIAEMGSDDEAELEAENELLKWKVMQLTTTGEQYRQKVEAMYVETKSHQMGLQRQIDQLQVTKDKTDESASQTAAELALANTTRTKLEQTCSELKQALLQVATRLSDTKQRLQTKRVDTALAENDHDHLSKVLSASKGRIRDLDEELKALQQRRSAVLDSLQRQEAERDENVAEISRQEAALRQWEDNTATTGVQMRTLVSRLDAAIADCIQLTRTAEALVPSLSGNDDAVGRAQLSPLKVEDTSDELRELREVNRKLLEETQRAEDESASKLRAAERREQEWSSLCQEWEQREHSRESNWRSNLRAILFSE